MLTNREKEVMGLIATGATNKQIAKRLVISVETVKTHVSNILRKLNASTRAEAVGIAYSNHILS